MSPSDVRDDVNEFIAYLMDQAGRAVCAWLVVVVFVVLMYHILIKRGR